MKIEINGTLAELTPQQTQQVFDRCIYAQRLSQARNILEEALLAPPPRQIAVFNAENFIQAMDEASFGYILDVIVENFAAMQDPRTPELTTWIQATEEALWFQAEVFHNAQRLSGKSYTAMSTAHLLRYVYRHISKSRTVEFFTAHKRGGISHNKFSFHTASFGAVGTVFCRCFRTGHCFAWQVTDPTSKGEYQAFASAARAFLEAENSPSGIPMDTVLAAE